MLTIATDEDRIQLSKLRAKVWSGSLGEAQFQTRNKRLYSHPFAQRITTYLYKKDKEIVSSMDILGVSIHVKDGVRPGFLVASVLTPVEHRKKGYASKMLGDYFKTETRPGVLYSDIDPKFYERFGFTLKSVDVVRQPTSRGSSSSQEIDLEELVKVVNSERKKAMDEQSAAVALDVEFLDWQLDRFRLFHEFESMTVPITFAWKAHGHVFCAAGNPVKKVFEVLWQMPACAECLTEVSRVGHALGFAHYEYWDHWSGVPSGRREAPMLKLPGVKKPVFVDSQLCDWW